MFNPARDDQRILDLREYFDATRAHNDAGTFDDWASVMKALQTEDIKRSDYIALR